MLTIPAALLLAVLPPLSVPAYTAYIEPNPEGVSVSQDRGITDWIDSRQHVVWYGKINTPGEITPTVTATLPEGEASELKLTIGKKSSIVELKGSGNGPQTLTFKPVTIKDAGYVRFELEGVKRTGKEFGRIQSLALAGAASENAQFNMKERRNAASVHLIYPIPEGVNATWFYNEVTVKTDPIWSYYMACGFRRGYFGIQVNSPTERRIIFSVWDSGNEGVDRSKVSADDKVQLLGKGDGVFAGGFGNEGTGGHSHLIYPWKTGSTYRFLVSAVPDGTHTVYSGYFFFPEKNAWGLIASFRAPKDGGYLRGLYSFNENFGGANGELKRLAQFGNQWIKSADGKWIEIVDAKFSCDGTGKKDRFDYASGVDADSGRFYLSNGGFFANGVKFGDPMTRPATGKSPADINLPK